MEIFAARKFPANNERCSVGTPVTIGERTAPGGGRTHNLWLRRPTLCPVELRARLRAELATDFSDFHRYFLPMLAFAVVLELLSTRHSRNSSCKIDASARECAPQPRDVRKLMNRIIDLIDKEQQKGDLTSFAVGDSVRVHTRVVEGDKERIQIFAGVVIGRKGRGLNETFTVRRISYGEGVERVFPLHSPRIAKIEVEQEGRARRAKLNYLRTQKGKQATAVRE